MGFNEKLINFRVDPRPASVTLMAPVVRNEELEVQARFAARRPRTWLCCARSWAIRGIASGTPASGPHTLASSQAGERTPTASGPPQAKGHDPRARAGVRRAAGPARSRIPRPTGVVICPRDKW